MKVESADRELAKVAATVAMPLDPAFTALVEAVHTGGHEVTDELVQGLLDTGYIEDQIFECIVAAAVQVGATRVSVVAALLSGGQR